MKKYLFFSIVILALVSQKSFAQSGTGQICFIRPGSYTGAVVNFRVSIDGKLVCKLKNKSYSMHSVSVGEHSVSGQNTGLTLDKGSVPLKVIVKEGKTPYISVIAVSNKVMCQEITENSAKAQLAKSKLLTNCGTN